MLKSIPKSNITKRKFQVYKLWNTDQTTYPVELISGSNPLYRSVRAKYYNQTDGNVFTTFGSSQNLAEISIERTLTDTIWVIDIDRDKFGEQIKKKSVRLIDSSGNEYVDDGYGKIINPVPTYNFTKLDLELGILTIEQMSIEYPIDVVSFDLQSTAIVLLDNGVGETYYVVNIDFETGIVTFTYELDFEGLGLEALKYGNVFYSDGVIVINGEVGLSTYELQYRSTQTIYETEVLVSVKAGEFNYSQNPTAVDVILSGSYDFETTPITNVSPAKTVKIKEVLDIEQRQYFSGSIGNSIGSWEDYYTSASVDPTGSYLAPFITTIGLYDKDGDMVAIAKLPRPIKNLPDYDLNFLIRFDT
jgi:hypothetical protein